MIKDELMLEGSTLIRRRLIDDRPIVVVDGAFNSDFIEETFVGVVGSDSLCYGRINKQGAHQAPMLVDLPTGSHSASEHLRRIDQTSAAVLAKLELGPMESRQQQINFNSYGEVQYAHKDEGFEITAIYFANPEWNPDWLGETFFYEEGSREVCLAVTPKPGRLLMFDSLIEHRGGVPSRLCWFPRVTIVNKYCSAGPSGAPLR